MNEIIIAGASEIDNIGEFIALTQKLNLNISLVENEYMYGFIPDRYQEHVLKSSSVFYSNEIFIPLNEHWVSVAKRYQVANISENALKASRSKYYLSSVLNNNGASYQPRHYLDDVDIPPEFYIARVDSGYSSYGIVSNRDIGVFNKCNILKSISLSINEVMNNVLDIDNNKVVVEEYLNGDEYSVDVFVNKDNIKVLRYFYKSISWVNGKPICDCYISVTTPKKISDYITKWCQALFSDSSISFGHFDFIISNEIPIPIDFSCRVGGGLRSIKEYANSGSYIFNSIFTDKDFFQPFICQKNIVNNNSGVIKNVTYQVPSEYSIFKHRAIGDTLHGNISSSNAKIADICFLASDLNSSIRRSNEINKMVIVHV